MNAKRLVALVTFFSFMAHTLPAFAIDLDKSFSGSSVGQSEYFNSNKDKRMMIQVNILSGVSKPGIHQIPDNTNLLDALALAGGLTPDSDFERVIIKRKSPSNKNSFDTMEVDVTEIMKDSKEALPLMRNYDTVLVEQRPRNEQKLQTALAILASTMSIVTGYFVIQKLK